MPTAECRVEVKRELPRSATCVECHRSYRPRSEEQACLDLCDCCYDDFKFPHKRVISVHVHVRPERPRSRVVR